MNTQIILPDPDVLPLPAAAWFLQVLLHLTFFLHLLAMNAMLGSLAIGLWARIKGTTEDQWEQLGGTLAKVTPSLVAATVTLGVAPLLFIQVLYGQFLFTSSILMAWGWFSIIVVLIFAYYGTYLQSFHADRLGSGRSPILAMVLIGFLWVGFMFSNNMTLMLDMHRWAGMYFADPGGTHLNTGQASLLPRYLHMVVGAVGVGGLMLVWWGRSRQQRGDQTGAFMQRVGVSAFTWSTTINIALGLVYLLSLEKPLMKTFMGGNALATGLLTEGLVAGLVLLFLGWRSIRSGGSKHLMLITVLLAIQLAVMILMRDIVRGVSLGEAFRPEAFPVQAQILNLGIFVAMLVGGLAVLVWMFRKLYLAWDRS